MCRLESNKQILRSCSLSNPLTIAQLFTAILAWMLILPLDALSAIRCENLLTGERTGAEFLLQQNQNLHQNSFVQRAQSVSQRPIDKVTAFVEYLESMATRSQRSPFLTSKIHQVFFDQFVIKPDQVPQSYFDLQVRLLRERGHGNVILTPQLKSQLINSLIADQRSSLDKWINYLLSPDTNIYPMWLKYWIFTSMVKLAKFNRETGRFEKRSSQTVAPFIELNRESLSYLVDVLLKKVNGENLSDLADEQLRRLIEQNASFERLYSHALLRVGRGFGEFSTNQGRWIKYDKGSDHRPLVLSLAGHNTGWCTAAESTAKSQLASGDFYVYYSFDSEGRPTRPRLAIRMEEDSIAEVRGVGPNQNIDSVIMKSQILENKLKEFGTEGERYQRRERNMRRLTDFDRRAQRGERLNREDLHFLYEIDEEIVGFGYEKDPRIHELLKSRNLRDDLAVIFEVTPEEISLTKDEFLQRGSKVHWGHLDLNEITSIHNLRLPHTIRGSLSLRGLVEAKGLILPETLYGNLNLGGLVSAQGVTLPRAVHGYLELQSLTSSEGLHLPTTIWGYLDLRGLTNSNGLTIPSSFSNTLHLNSLTSVEGLVLPENINGSLYLTS